MADVQLETVAPGRYRLRGELSFATVCSLLDRYDKTFDSAPDVVIDLADVEHSDSAGLALLIEWLRLAKQENKKLSYSSLPPQLLALARLSDLDDLLVAEKPVSG